MSAWRAALPGARIAARFAAVTVVACIGLSFYSAYVGNVLVTTAYLLAAACCSAIAWFCDRRARYGPETGVPEAFKKYVDPARPLGDSERTILVAGVVVPLIAMVALGAVAVIFARHHGQPLSPLSAAVCAFSIALMCFVRLRRDPGSRTR